MAQHVSVAPPVTFRLPLPDCLAEVGGEQSRRRRARPSRDWCLGPFELRPMDPTLLAQVSQDSRTYTTGAASLPGHLSKIEEITLTAERRKKLALPEAAKKFCFAYPVWNSSKPEEDGLSMDEHNFRTLGGYVYFSEHGVCAVTALALAKDGGSLRFGCRMRPPHMQQLRQILERDDRLQPVNKRFSDILGKVEHCWIGAGESFVRDGVRQTAADWPHGAFAFFFEFDESYDCYFAIEAGWERPLGTRAVSTDTSE
uniref:Uncharacterized protein n=1 Tax=Eutreptiella gymnastica TaxID=73025 RepID=A0A7S1IVB6_9EUGL|mmetsp:Transcript_4446/g.7883  ORF Transcript_4446/g.7883 Transcript_4446/m.7883 type:complete len:256 (+) Transcript_4446:286-1053(+)